MLRKVNNLHCNPRLIPFKFTTTATPSATLNSGYGNLSVTRSGTAGAGTLTPRIPFQRKALFIATQQTTTGGYATVNTTTASGSSFAYSLLDNGGSAADGIVQGVLFGWDSSDTNLVMPQKVKVAINAPKLLWGKITGATGAVAIGANDFACTRTGTGVYAITYRANFGKTPIVLVTGIASGAASTGKVTSDTAQGCTITMGTQAAAADQDFYIAAIGCRSTSDAENVWSVAQTTQRKPRMIAATVTNTSGAWTLSTGAGDFSTTVTDNGVGDFSLAISTAFAREPAVFATTTTQRAQCSTAATTSAVRILTRNAAGANADTDGVTHVLVIGSDDASEY